MIRYVKEYFQFLFSHHCPQGNFGLTVPSYTETQTRQVIMREKALVVWKSGLLGTVQEYEEKAIEVLMALESNLEILIRLRTFYSNLADRALPEPERHAAGEIIRQFVTKVDELMSDLQTQISRVRVLEKNVADRKTIVSFSRGLIPTSCSSIGHDYKVTNSPWIPS